MNVICVCVCVVNQEEEYVYMKRESVIENLMQREVRTKKPFLEIFWCDDDQNP
jgi:hypothetical protein